MKKKVACIHLAVMLLATSLLSQDKLYVYYPTTARPQVLQEKMTSTFKGVSVTVFGRFNDFNLKVRQDPPKAVITKPMLIEQIGGYTIALRAMRGGSPDEKYVLMSINTPLEIETVSDETVLGTIDLFGRAGTRSFIEHFFSVEPKIKRVTKVEDLLPLLSFNMAAGVLIEDVFVDYFKTTSQLQFSVTPLKKTTSGILALAVREGESAESAVIALKQNDKEICEMFEVDLWK